MKSWLKKVKNDPRTVIYCGIIILLCSLYLIGFLPEPIQQKYKRETVKERFPTEENLVKELLTQGSLSEEGWISNGTELFPIGEIPAIEIFGASGKYYKIIGQFNESPTIKYCTKEQCIDMILGNMLWRHFIFNHDDYVFVETVLNKCFDGQLETIFLGEFRVEGKITEEEFANDIENTFLPFEDVFRTSEEFVEPDITDKLACRDSSDELDKMRKESEKIYFAMKKEYEERHKKMQENWQWAKEHIIESKQK